MDKPLISRTKVNVSEAINSEGMCGWRRLLKNYGYNGYNYEIVLILQVKQARSSSSHAASDDDDDDVPLVSFA